MMTSAEKRKRKLARGLVVAWYAFRLENGLAKYMPGGGRIEKIVPNSLTREDQFKEAKKARPENWKQARVRSWTDHTGAERFDFLSLTDFATARGKETKPPPSGGSVLKAGISDTAKQATGTYVKSSASGKADRIMRVLAGCCMSYHKALEMSAAGWPARDIGEELGCNEHKARAYVEAGTAAVMVLIEAESEQPPGNLPRICVHEDLFVGVDTL